ncbi:hypothetical protein DEU56DRAFT_733293 [Suillus clintonianus]|uniref:uncharacterized protein n=1 Tax=Suillus clintonianus TaxID=1904413 RepID=UPI001B867810|nr:uncharacterized protein DEU56DRAFT_733293 [Suillus clintonianus]KAG2143085.1 hypothetical protein DEU56DRAFT_733293 [Suillus clintonianus]
MIEPTAIIDLTTSRAARNPTSSATHLTTARNLQATLDDAKAGLRIVNARAELSAHTWDGIEEWVGEDGALGLKDPKIVESDVQAQISFLRKLKFLYLEQNAKDKYVKTIVSDDAPLVTPVLNEELRLRNEEKKAALREHKAKLAERRDDLRALSGFVEEGSFPGLLHYKKAQALTLQASTLSQKILDARLSLTRLRQAHPHPRLTITTANQQLDGQVEEMQALDAELAYAHEKIATVRERIKVGTGEVEKLRSVRAEVEKAVEIGAGERVEDGRVVGLYDWFSTTTSTHHALVSLLSAYSESGNELRLAYRVHEREVCMTLLFIPNTRRLAEARVEGVEESAIGDVVDAHVMANDVSGLVWAVLARARAT